MNNFLKDSKILITITISTFLFLWFLWQFHQSRKHQEKVNNFKNALLEISCNVSIREDIDFGLSDSPGNEKALQRAKRKIREIIKSHNLKRSDYFKLYKKYISISLEDSVFLEDVDSSTFKIKSEMRDRFDDECPELPYQFIDI